MESKFHSFSVTVCLENKPLGKQKLSNICYWVILVLTVITQSCVNLLSLFTVAQESDRRDYDASYEKRDILKSPNPFLSTMKGSIVRALRYLDNIYLNNPLCWVDLSISIFGIWKEKVLYDIIRIQPSTDSPKWTLLKI